MNISSVKALFMSQGYHVSEKGNSRAFKCMANRTFELVCKKLDGSDKFEAIVDLDLDGRVINVNLLY